MPKRSRPYPSSSRCPECVYWRASSSSRGGADGIHDGFGSETEGLGSGDGAPMVLGVGAIARPQKRQTIAASWISSAQYGHRFTPTRLPRRGTRAERTGPGTRPGPGTFVQEDGQLVKPPPVGLAGGGGVPPPAMPAPAWCSCHRIQPP